jgi:D-alanine-D-alanine ligase
VAADRALAGLAGFDVVFLALHGPGGEDGVVQGFLETAGIPYTGSHVLASALAMDKVASKAVARQQGIAVPEHVRAGEGPAPGYPCVVKPVAAGSSAGLRVADDPAGLESAVAELAPRWPALMVEPVIGGREVTGAVLEDPETGEGRVLPLVEIRHEGRRVFDLEAKYDASLAEEICPAPLEEVVAERVRAASLAMHRAIGCRGVSRSDFIVRDGVPVYLETNTIPGLTRESLLPKAAAAAGLSMADLLEGIVRSALRAREGS